MKVSEEATEKLDNIQDEFNKKTCKVILEEAKKNVKYKVGDIVRDHHQVGRIKSTKIDVSAFSRSFEISFKCERLTKKLIPFKKQETILIYDSNIEELIKAKN